MSAFERLAHRLVSALGLDEPIITGVELPPTYEQTTLSRFADDDLEATDR